MESEMKTSSTLFVWMILTFCLTGCMGVGLLARTGAKDLFSKKEKPPGERIAAAQEQAITAAHGGSPGTLIAWSDEKSGIQGALTPEASDDIKTDCWQYRQTIILAGETLQGQVTACSQKDGSWKLSGEPAPAQK
jgi:surface antigen